MNNKYYALALIIVTVTSFILNLLFLYVLDTEIFEAARRLFGIDSNFEIIALQKAALPLFLFLLFFFSAKIESYLFKGYKVNLTSSIFSLLSFLLILLPILFYMARARVPGISIGYVYVMIIQYSTTFFIIGFCSIIIYDYSTILKISKGFLGVFLFSIKSMFYIALLQFCIIGILISLYNVPVDSSVIWKYDGSFWQTTFIQPFIIIFSFSLGTLFLNRFQSQATNNI